MENLSTAEKIIKVIEIVVGGLLCMDVVWIVSNYATAMNSAPGSDAFAAGVVAILGAFTLVPLVAVFVLCAIVEVILYITNTTPNQFQFSFFRLNLICLAIIAAALYVLSVMGLIHF